MLLEIVRRLFAGLADDPANQFAGTDFTKPAPAAAFQRRSDMASQIAGIDAGRPLVAGHFEVVDLSDVRKSMGAAWQDLAGIAMRLMAEELESGLSEEDTFQPVGDCAFIVCFADQDRDRSTIRAGAIAERIRSRLSSELPKVADRLGVGRFVAEVPQDAIAGSDLPVAHALLRSLQTIRDEAREADRLANTALISDTRVLFQPCWDRVTSTIALNRVVLDPVIGRTILQKVKGVGDPTASQRALAELDYAVFTKAVMALHDMARRRANPAPLVVPVQQSTLATESSRAAYFALLDTLPDSYRPLIVIEVLTALRGEFRLSLTELVRQLRERVNKVVLRIAPGHERLMWIAGNMWGVSIDLTDQLAGSSPLPVAPLMRAAKTLNVKVLVLGANTLAAMTLADNAGFDFLSGGAVHLTTDAPKPANRYNPFVGLGDFAPTLEAQARRLLMQGATPIKTEG
jgi:hypothetical protein